jgi:hypothetical protein
LFSTFVQNQVNSSEGLLLKATDCNTNKEESCVGEITGVSGREFQIDIESKEKQEKDCGDDINFI